MPALTDAERQAKLKRLAELLGFKTVDEMFDAAVTDTACPGICINPWCEYVATVAPSEQAGYCPRDSTNTVTCGTASESLTVTVIDPATLPTIDFPGISGTFTWTTENADSCTASGDWSGAQDTGGSQTFSLPGLGSFTLTCTGTGGTVTRTLTITTDIAASTLASTKFQSGQRVQTTDALNVRESASLSGTLLGTQPAGATGTVVGGPMEADGYWWWQIDYDDAPDGWSAENWLAAL